MGLSKRHIFSSFERFKLVWFDFVIINLSYLVIDVHKQYFIRSAEYMYSTNTILSQGTQGTVNPLYLASIIFSVFMPL